MSEKTAKDWEDRVVLLEQQATAATTREQAMAKELAEAKAKADSLAVVVEQARAAEKARREREVEGFMAEIRAKAQPNAISEPDLVKVKALFDRGDDENARFVAGLLLKSAAGGAVRGEVIPLANAGGVDSQPQAEARGAAALLKAAGFNDSAPSAQKGR